MKNEFIAYEYKEVSISKSKAPMFLDLVENYGWEVVTKTNKLNKLAFSLKRCYNGENKETLTVLENDFFSIFEKIEKINTEKKDTGIGVSLGVGLLGTACMAGATFSFLSSLIVPMVVLAVPGFVMWGLAPFLNKKINAKKELLARKQIEELTNKLYEISKQAFELLNKENASK